MNTIGSLVTKFLTDIQTFVIIILAEFSFSIEYEANGKKAHQMVSDHRR